MMRPSTHSTSDSNDLDADVISIKTTGLAQEQSNFFTLPPEVRERIYVLLFDRLYASTYKRIYPKQSMKILQTCRRIHGKASSVLYKRVPLRLQIGHLSTLTSTPVVQAIVDRFQHIYFSITRMSSCMPHHEFAARFDELTPAIIKSPFLRKTCHIDCELVEFGTGACGAKLRGTVKDFRRFDTVTIHYIGRIRKKLDFKAEKEQDAAEMQRLRHQQEWMQDLEEKALADVRGTFYVLERDLGRGELLEELPEGNEALYVRRLVFHPSRLAPTKAAHALTSTHF